MVIEPLAASPTHLSFLPLPILSSGFMACSFDTMPFPSCTFFSQIALPLSLLYQANLTFSSAVSSHKCLPTSLGEVPLLYSLRSISMSLF